MLSRPVSYTHLNGVDDDALGVCHGKEIFEIFQAVKFRSPWPQAGDIVLKGDDNAGERDQVEEKQPQQAGDHHQPGMRLKLKTSSFFHGYHPFA